MRISPSLKPVVVLSNNLACLIYRIEEAKALGIGLRSLIRRLRDLSGPMESTAREATLS